MTGTARVCSWAAGPNLGLTSILTRYNHRILTYNTEISVSHRCSASPWPPH